MSPVSAFVLPGLRSPFAKIDRELSRCDGLALSAPVIQQTVAGDGGPGRDGADRIDLFLWGAVIPSLTVSNWGREAWFDAGLEASVPAQGIVQACATSIAAATHAAGRADLALCGGVEAMSHTQIGLSPGLSRSLRRIGSAGSVPRMVGTLAGIRPRDLRISAPAIKERTTGKTMGQHAEEMARKWDIPREAQDRLALLIAPAVAIAELLHGHGLSLDDIGLWEFHEAFAAQVLCTIAALEDADWLAARSPVKDGLGAFPRDRVNPNGGSVALGHPFGATGARILSQTVLELADRPAGTRAIVSVCAAGGLGHVALLEAV